jgi:hypothetical protein
VRPKTNAKGKMIITRSAVLDREAFVDFMEIPSFRVTLLERQQYRVREPDIGHICLGYNLSWIRYVIGKFDYTISRKIPISWR